MTLEVFIKARETKWNNPTLKKRSEMAGRSDSYGWHMKTGWESGQESRLLSCWRNRRWKTCPSAQTHHKASSTCSLQLGSSLPSSQPFHSRRWDPQLGVKRGPHQWYPTVPENIPPVDTCSQPPTQCWMWESLCSHPKKYHHPGLAQWGFSSCLALPLFIQTRLLWGGRCAPANDTRCWRWWRWMNVMSHAPIHSHFPPCCHRLCLSSAQAGVAPGGGRLGPAAGAIHRFPCFLDPITWQVSVEAGTIRCQFAARLAEGPRAVSCRLWWEQGCRVPALAFLGLWHLHPGLPCLCDALTATTRATVSLQDRLNLYYPVSEICECEWVYFLVGAFVVSMIFSIRSYLLLFFQLLF